MEGSGVVYFIVISAFIKMNYGYLSGDTWSPDRE
jgi:hypothetical protein